MAGPKVMVAGLPLGLERHLEEMHSRNRREELVWHDGKSSDPFNTVSVICPFCNKEVAAVVHSEITQGQFAETQTRYWVAECPVCMRPIVYDNQNHCTFPGSVPFENVKNLTENVEKIYDECRKACGNGCYTASVILARTLLNHVAVDQGAEENKSFQYYVNYLVENYMPPKAKTWVDSIRVLANDSTHHLEIMEKTDAEQVLKFVMYLLKYIYELPAELA